MIVTMHDIDITLYYHIKNCCFFSINRTTQGEAGPGPVTANYRASLDYLTKKRKR